MSDDRHAKFDIRARELRAKGKFYEPREVLAGMRRLQQEVALSDTPSEVRNLRTRKLKSDLEMRQGLLLCYGMSVRLGMELYYSSLEDSDYDGVIYFSEGDTAHFQPVQLKELVPVELNATANVQAVIDSLSKYGDSKDLLVGIHINRRMEIEFDELVPPPVELGAIYLFFALSEDQSQWGIYGDIQDGVRELTRFTHPE